MTRREQGDLAGWGSVAASAILWLCGLVFWQSWSFLPDSFFYVFIALGILALVLPIIAGWKASKLWLLMILGPLVGYIVVMKRLGV